MHGVQPPFGNGIDLTLFTGVCAESMSEPMPDNPCAYKPAPIQALERIVCCFTSAQMGTYVSKIPLTLKRRLWMKQKLGLELTILRTWLNALPLEPPPPYNSNKPITISLGVRSNCHF